MLETDETEEAETADPKVPTVANTFIITDVKVDVVYGTARPEVVAGERKDYEKPYIFNVKTSLQWFEDSNSVVYSGSPGYIKGQPLLIGTTAGDSASPKF